MRSLVLLLAFASAATAAPKSSAPLLLGSRDTDAALVLPAPPTDGSKLAADELRQLHEIDATRTPAEFAHAAADNALKNVTIFAGAMGPNFDLARLPETRALFDTVRAEEKAAADRAKEHFGRRRPWIVDAGLHPCSTDDDPRSSYPSGHVTMGYAVGAILSRLAPDHAAAVMTRAADYAHSRLVCEMHFPADVTAGQSWGLLVAKRLMAQPTFRARFDRARRELIVAGLTS